MHIARTANGWVRECSDGWRRVAHPNEPLNTWLEDLTSIAQADVGDLIDIDDARSENDFLPPVEPSQFIIAGLNYRAHCAEIGVPLPEKLVFGSAPASASTGLGCTITIVGEETDYEGEIGVVIGQPGDAIDRSDAVNHVAGIISINDVSARDLQAPRTLEALADAKGQAGFKPMGSFATLDHFPNWLDIGLKTLVNGEERQNGRSGDMIFDIPAIIEQVSARIPLKTGDVICTGTPGGVAHGGEHPYLKEGDQVIVAIEGLLPLENHFAR